MKKQSHEQAARLVTPEQYRALEQIAEMIVETIEREVRRAVAASNGRTRPDG